MNRQKHNFMTLAAASAILFSQSVLAQEGDDAETDEGVVIDEVVVEGFRQSLSNALNHKRYSDVQMDAIAAEDIGKLPDTDIGDVLERVAGVQIRRGDDGVPNGTNIRGFPGNFNAVLYNDRVITTSLSTNRFFDAQVMPAAFAKRVEVYKTSVADIMEGGLAGTVRLRTMRAFDLKKSAFRLRANFDNISNNSETNPEITAIYTGLFADNKVGFAIGGNFVSQDISTQVSNSFAPVTRFRENANNNRDFNGDGDFDDDVFGPNNVILQLNTDNRERLAAFSNFEWRPNDNFSLFTEVLHSEYDVERQFDVLRFQPRPVSNVVPEDARSVVYNDYEYWTGMHVLNMSGQVQSTPNLRDSNVTMFILDGTYTTGPWTVALGAHQSKSQTNQLRFISQALLPTPANGYEVTLDGSRHDRPWSVTYHDADAAERFADSANYRNFTVNATHLDAEYENNSRSFDFSLERELGFSDAAVGLTSFKLGVHVREDENLAIQPRANFNVARTTTLLDGAEVPMMLVDVDRGSWFDGAASTGGAPLPWLVPDSGAIRGMVTFDEIRQSAEDLGIYDAGAPNNVLEDIFAAYVRLNFASRYDRLNGNFGVRYVATDQDVVGVGADLNGFIDDGTGVLTLPTGDVITRSRSYSEFLPSLNMRVMLTDNQLLRIGASRTISRAEIPDLRPSTNYNDADRIINTSDPDLEPFFAESFDLSWEWYFADESLLSVALFHKDLESLIRVDELSGQLFTVTDATTGATRQEEFTIRGRTNTSGATLKGYEIAFQQPFTYMPGFLSNMGIRTSYTYIENSEPESLRGAAEDNVNLVLYYDIDKLDVHMSYTFRDDFMRFAGSDTNLGIGLRPADFFDSSNRVNLSLNYRATDKLNVNLAISNLTDEAGVTYWANGLTNVITDSGRRVTLGFAYRL